MGCAVWSRQIALRIGHHGAEETFIAGLLHDMGKALFYQFFRREFLALAGGKERDGSQIVKPVS